jgi:transcriptional regulator with XRE-family HTH domain
VTWVLATTVDIPCSLRYRVGVAAAASRRKQTRMTNSKQSWHRSLYSSHVLHETSESRLFNHLATKILEFRRAAGMSQEELSGRAQMKRSSIANIETRRQRPPLDAIYRIALALEVSVHDLIPEMDQLLADDVKVASEFRDLTLRQVKERYYENVHAYACLIRARRAGMAYDEFPDVEELIHEYADGSNWVCDSYRAKIVCLESDNCDEWIMADGSIRSVEKRAYFALCADIKDALRRLAEDDDA